MVRFFAVRANSVQFCNGVVPVFTRFYANFFLFPAQYLYFLNLARNLIRAITC